MDARASSRFARAARRLLGAGGLALLWLATGSCGGGSGSNTPDPRCGSAPGDGPWLPEDGSICERLSTYNVISLEDGKVVPGEGVLPYDLTTPLFSDYALKTRTIWVPEGETIAYRADGFETFDFPVGTIITKTFSFPEDMSAPDENVRALETRLLVRRSDGWEALPYVWNEDMTEAIYTPIGDTIPVSFTKTDGEDISTDYVVPNKNQCLECHANIDPETEDKTLGLIGPKAKHLNRDLDYGRFLEGEGTANQLTKWTEEGLLAGVPADPPRLPAWDDPSDGSLHERARAYLDSNCAHCHNSAGTGAGSGLLLTSEEDDPHAWGVCQGLQRGIGGDVELNIVPGDPAASAFIARMDTLDPKNAMPRLGRTLIHDEGVEIVREWILWLGTRDGVDTVGLEDYSCFEQPAGM